MAEHQSAQMPKITNDGLTQSGTGCFIAVPIWQQWASKDECIIIQLQLQFEIMITNQSSRMV